MSNNLFDNDVVFIDLAFAIMTFDRTSFLVDDFEASRHRFVVGDTLRVVAFHQSDDFVWQGYPFLFYHFVIADDIQNYIRSYQSDAADLVIVEKLV